MKRFLFISVLIFSIFHFPFSIKAQVRPVYDYGAIGLGQLLKKLQTTKSVMMIGAHPDDEDSALLAYLARGENARTAYLSLTRGDGGQNLLGDELFESLGVIRTEELLQARRLDGAEQFFTRAFDYGFSKTLTEAKSKWDEKIILCDTVRAIRQFRPLVVISRFSGTPADGHGQHQFAGYISPLAVKAAADPNQCKDSGTPWEVKKFYVGQGFRSTAEPTLRINTGKYDPLIGRSYFEIAMEGRSQHKTQEQGVLELKGDQFSGLNLVESRVERTEKEKSIFDGIDTSISSLLKIPDLPERLSNGGILEIQKLTEKILNDFNPQNPQKLLPDLLNLSEVILNQTLNYNCIDGRSTGSGYGNCDQFTQAERRAFSEIQNNLIRKRSEVSRAVQMASGIQIDALTDKETVVPGEKFTVTVRAYVPDSTNAIAENISVQTYNGWLITEKQQPTQGPPAFRRENADAESAFEIGVGENWKNNYTQPYWLKIKRGGNLFNWDSAVGSELLPFEKTIGYALVAFQIEGKDFSFSQPFEYRYADDVRGEIRRELNIVPKISIEFEKDLTIVSENLKAQKQKVRLLITNNSDERQTGTANLILPEGWSADKQLFFLEKKGEKTAVEFNLTIPPNFKRGNYEIKAEASVGNEKFTQTMHTISYPHIQTHRYYTDAKTNFNLFDLKVASLRVGYIQGSGDKVPQAIEQMGLNVTMLDENYLSTGDLLKFDTIVVGVRASQTRPDFVANNKRLSDFMTNGGTLIVQYQQYEYVRANLPPFPAKMDSNIRTVDENAPVRILAPAHPVFNFPNKITEKDFDHWVQERNLYTFTSFDKKYTPLLETHDAGEAESKGGMVYAEVGKGKYVYTAYSFFRQLPAGNQGAFRLFANLLSLPKSG